MGDLAWHGMYGRESSVRLCNTAASRNNLSCDIDAMILKYPLSSPELCSHAAVSGAAD